jgi:hypothetical protein
MSRAGEKCSVGAEDSAAASMRAIGFLVQGEGGIENQLLAGICE